MVLPGVSSVWNYIRAGVPGGSILVHLLFLLFKNDIVNGIDSNKRLFTDDITVNPVLSGHSKIDKTKVSLANGSLMKDESIAECSYRSILQYF